MAGDVSSGDRVGNRVVLGFLAERVDVGTLVPCVEAAGGQSGIGLQLFREIGPTDAQVGHDPVGRRNTGVALKFPGDSLLLVCGDVGAFQESGCVIAEGEILNFMPEWLELRGLDWNPVVVPRGGCH
jgi:hypothetical protein